MKTRPGIYVLTTLMVVLVALVLAWLAEGHATWLFQPRGTIATQERNLIVTAVGLMLLIVIPVFVLTFTIAWRYRDGKGATYTPDWDHNAWAETAWWGIPCLIILCLAVLTWTSTHRLDPAKALASSNPPLTIQVVALDWKWLFIYPNQGIATVNYVRFPANVPVNFEITSDAPMNSFWIPQLGGQIYAMPAMSTDLHLIANDNGSYAGSSANLSGAGFAGMKFTAQSTSGAEFNQWAATVKTTSKPLNYATLAKPSQNLGPSYYALNDPDLYDQVIMKYLAAATPVMQMQ